MKLRFTHNDIKAMVTEAFSRLGGRTLLNEISSELAYTRFYQGKLSQKAYDKLMVGAEQMTPLHKLAADHMVALYAQKNYRGVSRIAEIVSVFWNNATEESKQYVVRVCKSDANELKSDSYAFRNILSKLTGMKSHSEGSYVDRGFEILYEDENVRVTCTKSYSSSCHHYGKSHWCTASDQFGEYDGFEMFKRYTIENRSVLVQFFIKQNPSKTCQAQITLRNTFSVICDWEDQMIRTKDLNNILEEYGIELTQLQEEYIRPELPRLFQETTEIVNDENIYYERKKKERLRMFVSNIEKALKSKECVEFAKQILNSASWRGRTEDDTYRGYREEIGDKVYVSISYDGKTAGEKAFLEDYFDDEWWSRDNYGVVTTNVVFLFDKSGNLLNKFPGSISVINDSFLVITDMYDEYLNFSIVNYIVDAKTGNVILSNVKPVGTDDCDDYISEFRDEMNDRAFNKLFKGKYEDGQWYVFVDNAQNAFAISPLGGGLIRVPYVEGWADWD